MLIFTFLENSASSWFAVSEDLLENASVLLVGNCADHPVPDHEPHVGVDSALDGHGEVVVVPSTESEAAPLVPGHLSPEHAGLDFLQPQAHGDVIGPAKPQGVI